MEYISKKRLWYVCLTSVTLLITVTLLEFPDFIYSFHSRLLTTSLEPRSSKMSYNEVCYDICDPRDTRFYNIISEEEALSYKPCNDVNLAASAEHSSLSFKDRKNRIYTIGGEINVLATIYDGYGKRIQSGGDQLRATIENKQLQASAPCVVTDNRDGTHSVTCDAFWLGTSTIVVTIAFTRQTVTAHYRMRTQNLSIRTLYGLFESGLHKEALICHPNQTELLKKTNYTELCNMTYINSGMSFYCGKPKNEHLLCQDLKMSKFHEDLRNFNVTRCDEALLKRGQKVLKETLNVTISVVNTNKSGVTISKPTIPCSQYNRTLLWQSRKPTGYFYRGKWNLTNCIGFQQNQYQKCLKDRRLYLIGDSTIRAWYPQIVKRFKCQHLTEKWTTGKWHKMGECYNKELNFKAGWYPHAQPFFLGGSWEPIRYSLYSTSRQIDDVPDNEHAIIVFHLYAHLIPYHHSLLKDRLQIIRKSIEGLFARNKHSIVLFKAPHTFTFTPTGALSMCDYYGFVYSKILYEVFEGLFERVILLNNKDCTTARHERLKHPPDDIVNFMIDQMLSYAC